MQMKNFLPHNRGVFSCKNVPLVIVIKSFFWYSIGVYVLMRNKYTRGENFEGKYILWWSRLT